MNIFKICSWFLLMTIILLLNTNCSKQVNRDEIKIGMKYDEVETILGKPSAIERGINELGYDLNTIPADILKRIDLDNNYSIENEKQWIVKNEISTVGNLLYVTWIYEDIQKDTFFVVMNNYQEIIDTIKTKIPKYFINDRQVSKNEYDRISSNQETGGKKPRPSIIEKRIEYHSSVSIERREEITGTEKTSFEVMYKFCVIFDSASGRVTKAGYYPFNIADLKEIKLKDGDNKIS